MPTYSFNAMKMLAATLQPYVATTSDFEVFGFRFELSGSVYSLRCAAFDTNKNLVNPNVTMQVETSVPPLQQTFDFKAVTLMISKTDLITNGFNGTTDMYLLPFSSGSGNPYFTSYKVNSSPTFDTIALAVTPFSINPSPPYKR